MNHETEVKAVSEIRLPGGSTYQTPLTIDEVVAELVRANEADRIWAEIESVNPDGRVLIPTDLFGAYGITSIEQ